MTRLERELKTIRSEMSELLSAATGDRPSVINVGGMIQEFTPTEAFAEWRVAAKRAERKIKEIRRARDH